MAQIKGLSSLVNKLEAMAAKARKEEEINVEVGYTAAYALHVHENRQMKWRGLPRDRSVRRDGDIVYTGYTALKKKRGVFWGPAGRAGFLLDVAREMMDELAGIIRDAIIKKQPYWKALKIAGLRLQRESQKNVPVDTGNLRASAFTRVTGISE